MQSTTEALNYLNIPGEMPIVPIFANVIFPSTLYPLYIKGADTVSFIAKLHSSKAFFGLFLQRDQAQEQPQPEDLYQIGTTALIYSAQQEGPNLIRVMIQGLARIRLQRIVSAEPYYMGRVELLPDIRSPEEPLGLAELERQTRREFQLYLQRLRHKTASMQAAADEIEDPTLLAYMIASTALLPVEQRQQILEAQGAYAKLQVAFHSLRQLRNTQQTYNFANNN